MKFERGQRFVKNYDRSIVTVSEVGSDYVKFDGDFEPNHVVMKSKVLSYYTPESREDAE